MVQELNKPETEQELYKILDDLYSTSKEEYEKGRRPRCKGLLEVISSEPVIISAIHRLKSNRGSQTPGSDSRRIRDAILHMNQRDIINLIQTSLYDYKAQPVRRVLIPKPGKKEKRPLGIPTIIDRVIQECVRMVIQPILEAQFFAHSYGSRPMRDAGMVLTRLQTLCNSTRYCWVVEGDISKFFDNVNHTILIKRLYGMGIRDRRVLMIIKEMLKAGVMGETFRNELGTPQGGIISPLLANVYLDALDHFVSREWEKKKTRYKDSKQEHRLRALRKTKLRPAFFVRYMDDWVLFTNSKENAQVWKERISEFLHDKLKLELSGEKTLITNVTKRPIKFLGFDFKRVTNDGKKYITRTKPNEKLLRRKLRDIKHLLKAVRKAPNEVLLLAAINRVNSKIRGLINYFQAATWVHIIFRKYAERLKYSAYKALKRRTNGKVRWVNATRASNLIGLHTEYASQNIPAIEHKGLWIGITNLRFCKWEFFPPKNQKETPHSPEGREIYAKRTGKKPLKLRVDELFGEKVAHSTLLKVIENPHTIYNFEYMMNRAYAFNRDKGKCRVCGDAVQTHHINPHLPIELINRVNNLASVHYICHQLIHGKLEAVIVTNKMSKNIKKFRDKLGLISG